MGGRTWLVVAVLSAALFLVGCTGEQTQSGNQKQSGKEESSSEAASESTTEPTTAQGKTSEATPSPSQVSQANETGKEASSEPAEVRPPEEVLALQYEYINRGDFENAYSLFAEQSQREVSLEQYGAFFEANAPYSVTDYSFSPSQVQGGSASLDAVFTVNSAAGSEQLQRTQRFVQEENGEWRVVMRPDQVAALTATSKAVSSKEEPPDEAQPSPPRSPANSDAGDSKSKAAESSETQTITIRVSGTPGMSFSGNYGTLDSSRSVDGTTPDSFEVEVKTGFLEFDSVSAVMQKQEQGSEELTVQMLVDGEVVKEQSTTAQFGVVSLNYLPGE
jgi:hypothetical protein